MTFPNTNFKLKNNSVCFKFRATDVKFFRFFSHAFEQVAWGQKLQIFFRGQNWAKRKSIILKYSFDSLSYF
jgi:hypothetical protein